MEKTYRRSLIFVFILFMMLGSFASSSYGDEDGKIKWGFSMLTGFNGRSKPDLTLIAIHPRAGVSLHKNWALEFEGNFSYFSIKEEKDLYLLGTNINILFKPVRWGKGSFFLIGGTGLAYNNNDGEVREMGDSNVAGVLQGGIGVYYEIYKGWELRGGYRFQHISDPLKGDIGFNIHNFALGISF